MRKKRHFVRNWVQFRSTSTTFHGAKTRKYLQLYCVLIKKNQAWFFAWFFVG